MNQVVSPPLTRNKKKKRVESPAQKTPEQLRLEEPSDNGFVISPVFGTREISSSSPEYNVSTFNRFENLDTDEPAPTTTGTQTTTSAMAPTTTATETQTEHCDSTWNRIVRLCKEGVLKPFTNLLEAKDDKTVILCLDDVYSILSTAEKLGEKQMIVI